MFDDEIQTSSPEETGPEPRPVYAQPSLGQPPQFEGQTHFADQTPFGDQTHFSDPPSAGPLYRRAFGGSAARFQRPA